VQRDKGGKYHSDYLLELTSLRIAWVLIFQVVGAEFPMATVMDKIGG
jgi:hypothetical protein